MEDLRTGGGGVAGLGEGGRGLGGDFGFGFGIVWGKVEDVLEYTRSLRSCFLVVVGWLVGCCLNVGCVRVVCMFVA